MKIILFLLCILPASAAALPFKWWLPNAQPYDPSLPMDYWEIQCQSWDCTPRYPIPATPPTINARGDSVAWTRDELGIPYSWLQRSDGSRLMLSTPTYVGAFADGKIARTINDRGWIGGADLAYVRTQPDQPYFFGGAGPVIWDPSGKQIPISPTVGLSDFDVFFISDDGWACFSGQTGAWNVYTKGFGSCRGDPKPLSEPDSVWLGLAVLGALGLRRLGCVGPGLRVSLCPARAVQRGHTFLAQWRFV